MCFAIGLIAPGCFYTHNVIMRVATPVICEKACIEEGAIFRLFQTCWKLSSYMTGLNTCIRKLCELDTLFFQTTNWLMHKYYRRLCYRGNSSYFLSRLKATGYLDYQAIPQTNNPIQPYPKSKLSLLGKIHVAAQSVMLPRNDTSMK